MNLRIKEYKHNYINISLVELLKMRKKIWEKYSAQNQTK